MSAGHARAGGAVPRYGEFPHLFWDLAPDAPVDVGHDVVLARLLARGRPEDVQRLIALADMGPRLPTLPLPEPVRRFWTRVVTGRALATR